ncbi:MAG: hypothetical protein K2L22_00385 [Muribaculaceae bacterium]|nr:hypothetical protein [Muribaculaceae bacterium]
MKNRIISLSLFLLLGIAIWWMSANVVWLGDDLDYKYMMKGEIWQSWGKIKTVKAFFESQWVHYQHVNGRYVAHALVQLFNAKLGQPTFAVCNAIAYALFAFLIGKVSEIRSSANFAGVLSAICISVLCFITKMMPTCQIGYIWGILANLVWLMLFFKGDRPSWLYTIWTSILAIIVGNWQESVSIGVCGGLGIWWIIQLVASIKSSDACFEWRRSWMLLGYVVGTATNCLAPSTISRVSDTAMPLIDQLLIASYSFPAIILLIFCVIYARMKHQEIGLFSFKHLDHSIPNGVLTAGLLVLVVFNIAIGVYSNRQLFGANLFAAVLSLRLLPNHRFGKILNTLSAITVLAFWTLMISGITEVKSQYEKIIRFHAKSTDGSVYFNRTRVMTLGFPLRAKYYEDILGQFDNDLHHSLMKDFKHTIKGRTLKLKPTSSLDSEKVEMYAPGHFNVTLKEPLKGEAPREVIVYGHYPIPGIKVAPKIIEITKYAKRHTPYATTIIIPEFPFFTADSIKIIPNHAPRIYNLGCGTNQPIATP